MRWLKNVGTLSLKEWKSLFSDPILLVLIIYMFSVALYTVANMPTTEMHNAAVAVVDHDRSELSYALRDRLLPPNFNAVQEIEAHAVDEAMDSGKFTFVLDIPPNFEKEWLSGRQPKIQLLIDATAMTQAGVGLNYINQIFSQTLQQWLGTPSSEPPLQVVSNVLYNPNYSSKWFMGTMQLVGNLNLLMLLLSGAAVIREKERGTMEHLLVMPVRASEIAVAKIFANGTVLLTVVMLSLLLMVKGVLGVPIAWEMFPKFALGVVAFIFSIASLGILLATIAPTMPQFGLLCIPTYVVMYLLSGSNSPVENMPELAQQLTQFSPTTLFGAFTQDVLFRNAELSLLWENLLKMAGLGAIFLTIALVQFKSMLSKQG